MPKRAATAWPVEAGTVTRICADVEARRSKSPTVLVLGLLATLVSFKDPVGFGSTNPGALPLGSAE